MQRHLLTDLVVAKTNTVVSTVDSQELIHSISSTKNCHSCLYGAAVVIAFACIAEKKRA